MADFKEKRKCKCGRMAQHSIVLDHKDGNADSQMKDYSFYGDTGTRLYPCSVTKDGLAEARRQHPGTDYQYHNELYIPVIKNRAHKKKFLREHGYVELD
jgi:hypothetical protein